MRPWNLPHYAPYGVQTMQIDKDCKCTTEDNKELELVIVNALEKWENRKKEKDRENALLWQVKTER